MSVALKESCAEMEKTNQKLLDLFTDYKAKEEEDAKEEATLEREKRMRKAMLNVKKKFG